MLIFIDTEFTDFRNPQLISIALVAEEGGHEFYAELPYDMARCSDFVVDIVLPLLGEPAGALCQPDELKTRVAAWLAQFESAGELSICYDFDGDWRFFEAVFDGDVPAWIVPRNVFPHLDQQALKRYFDLHDGVEHHALHDARANRYALNKEKALKDWARKKPRR